ncbi:MAG: polyribonucleotide nucleotidyltransferase [Bacteroidales bacterium]|nr:polyribonucleotide nucleotidyltransferase [Bacteroidales bacterium]
MFKTFEKTITLDDGRTITIETGKLAKQADGSVVVRMGNTMLLASVVSAKEGAPDSDFMPLQVEYKEKFAAIGRFPGGFLKRESRPSDYEILISRLIDRALRPLFPDDYHAETFVNVMLISADQDTMPDALAGLAASSALMVSDVPFKGPISEVRVARIDGKLMINPTFGQIASADIDIMVAATLDNIVMVEGEMSEVSEDDMLEALKFAHEAIKVQCKAQLELMEAAGKSQKRVYSHEVHDEELRKRIWDEGYDKYYQIAKTTPAKHERHDALEKVKADFIASIPEGSEINEALINRYFHDVEKDAVRNLILNEGLRVDGRKTNEIRPIWCDVDYLPAAHGSAVFTRGETQSLTSVTLGTKLDEKAIDEVLIKGTEKFVLHYNFPPFSTGEARPSRGISRREVGHGNLAHRALKRMMPADNVYAIRVVSDILESNGSSSMATVCAGTMALMDAGVKILRPVSGIAMGLITDTKTGKYAILSDILGDEDHLGDMDFKVAGTRNGITATQMDIKVDGLTFEVLKKALAQANEGRMHILNKLVEAIPEPRADYKPQVPRMVHMTIPKEFIGAIIGPGGKIIQDIQAKTGAVINIEEVDGKGEIYVSSADKASIEAAMTRINAIVEQPEVGKIYKGVVKGIQTFGAFVEILPGKQGLLHISEIDWNRVEQVEDVLKEGDEVEVKLLEIDTKNGKLSLSRKVLLPVPEGFVPPAPRPPREPREPRGDSRGRRDQRDGRDRREHRGGGYHDRKD